MSTTNTLACQLLGQIGWNDQATLGDGTVIADAGKFVYSKTTGNGTAADLADLVWHDQRTVAGSGANDDLDLTALVRSVFGTNITTNFAKIKALVIINTSTVSSDVLNLDTSVTNGFCGWSAASATSKLQIGADSCALLASKKDGWTVDSSHKVLRVANPGSNSITYQIAIFGTSV